MRKKACLPARILYHPGPEVQKYSADALSGQSTISTHTMDSRTFSTVIIESFHDYNGAFRSFTLIVFHDYNRLHREMVSLNFPRKIATVSSREVSSHSHCFPAPWGSTNSGTS